MSEAAKYFYCGVVYIVMFTILLIESVDMVKDSFYPFVFLIMCSGLVCGIIMFMTGIVFQLEGR